MSDFTKCPDCGEYDFKSSHKCAPKWKVYHYEYRDEDPCIIHAYNDKSAAEKYAEKYENDTCEYDLMDGGELEIEIEPFEGGERKKFIVTGEPCPTYYAQEKKDDKDNKSIPSCHNTMV